MDYIIISLLVVLIILLVFVIIKLQGQSKESKNMESVEKNITDKLSIFSENNYNFQQQLRETMISQIKDFEKSNTQKLNDFEKSNAEKLSDFDKNNSEKISVLTKSVYEQLSLFERRMQGFTKDNSDKLQSIRDTLEKQLNSLQNDNNKKLDEMRKIVDEKLQDTLNKKMDESFKLVSERLEQVYKGLGEMQVLAQGVGDLKKVLTNVKSRGILGEIQLDAILKEILAPDQYETNVEVVKGSKNVVEFAVKLPTEEGTFIYLPIDSKFPGDSYRNLQEAYEKGIKEEVDLCAKNLISVMKTQAKSIRDKYINPPETTDFAVMFLPFEGLYAEVVNRGLVETLQNEYHINIAGPSTMAALLNSLQMGFKAFAIQKRSGEVWKVLSAVKTEFDKFEKVISSTQTRLRQADAELEKLVGVRTRQIQRSLRDVATLNEKADILEDEYEGEN